MLDKKALIKITTTQTEPEGQSDTSEITVEAYLTDKDNVRIITYSLEDSVNILMISNGFAKMVKQGDTQAQMLFAEGKETTAKFSAAGNELVFDVITTKCKSQEKTKLLDLEYALLMNRQLISEYKLNIEFIKKRYS